MQSGYFCLNLANCLIAGVRFSFSGAIHQIIHTPSDLTTPITPLVAVGCVSLPFSPVACDGGSYPQIPLDFSPLSTYFINTYPAVLRVSYRFSGAALLNTYSDTYCGFNTRYAFYQALKYRERFLFSPGLWYFLQ